MLCGGADRKGGLQGMISIKTLTDLSHMRAAGTMLVRLHDVPFPGTAMSPWELL